MAMTPIASICILTFNSAKFIVETVESAMKQTLQNIEILIVDNCSTDATIEICNQLKNSDSRISIYTNEIPLGISGGLNSCLERTKGEYVKFLMHDDILEPNCLERMIDIFNKFPSIKLVGCSEQQIDAAGNLLQALKPYPKPGLIEGRAVAKDILTKMTNIIGTPSSVLMRKTDYGDGFKRSLFLFEDTEMYLRILLQGDYYFIDECLSKVRVHSATGSSINCNTLVFISDLLQLKKMFADFMQEQGFSKEEWSEIVDERILSYTGHMLHNENVTEESVRAYAHRLKGLVGYDYTDQLVEAMAYIIFYGFSRLFETNLQARFNKQENDRLVQEVNLMSNSLPFKMTQPLRSLKAKLFAGQ